MAIRSGFFNSVNGDRKYNAGSFAEYFATFIGNGVFPNPSDNLQIIANNDMTVTVSAGKAWINGYILINDDDYILTIDPADGVLNRIDRIVVRYDTVDREIRLEVKKGTFASSPTAPALQRDADAYELGLADIYVGNGTISITQANITDLRQSSEHCGIVHGTVDQVDTTTIFNQYQAWFNSITDGTEQQIADWQQQQYDDFMIWFQSIQDILEGDVAANLASRISSLENDFMSHLADMTHIPSGLIAMWSGSIDNIPGGWALCDGTNGTPDLRDRFIVGAGSSYNVGDTGGLDSVTLTTSQLPSHSHGRGTLSTDSAGSHSHTITINSAGSHSHSGSTSTTGSHTHSYQKFDTKTSSGINPYTAGSSYYFTNVTKTTDSAGSHSHTITINSAGSHSHSGSTSTTGSHSHTISGSTGSAGSGQAHENRPPYYALAFIMKL